MEEVRLHLRVVEKIVEAPRVVTLKLAPKTGRLEYEAGQFLTFIFNNLGQEEIRRSYSMSSTPGIDPQLSVTVKQQANGVVSRYLVQKIKVGDLLTALPPAGQFVLSPRPDQPRDLFFFAGGSGITPVFSLLKKFLREEPQSRLHLLDANRNEQHIIFREQLKELARLYPTQWHCAHLLSTPQQDVDLNDDGRLPIRLRWGRLSNALVENWVAEHLTYNRNRAQFFLCGPQGLMLKTRMCLGYMGFDDRQIHREIFDIIAPYRPPADRYAPATMELYWQGRQWTAPVAAGQTLLEAAERTGIDLPYSCRSGICTTCTAQCLEGKAEMHTPEGTVNTQNSQGAILTCVGYPLSEKIVIKK